MEVPLTEKELNGIVKKITGKGTGYGKGGHYETFNRSDGFICRGD